MAHVDVEMEMDVLARSVQDVEFARLAMPVLRAHEFSSANLAWVCRILQDTFSRNREIPTPAIFGVHAERDFPDELSREPTILLLLKLFRRNVPAPKTSLDVIRDFLQMTALRTAAAEMAEKIDDGDLDSAKKALSGGQDALRATSIVSRVLRWGENLDERLADYQTPDLAVRARTPFQGLDRALNGGLPPGRIGVVLANTNIGKSTWLTDIGYTALFRSGFAVVHITTEETAKECMARYDSRHTSIDRSRLEGRSLTSEDAELFSAKFSNRKEITKRLFIHEMPPGSDIAGVYTVLEDVRREYLDLPLLCVIDSPDHMKSDAYAKDGYRLMVKAVFENIKALSTNPVLRPCCLWVSGQARKQDAGKLLTAESSSESYDKTRIADVVVGLTEGDASGTSNGEVAMRVNMAKNRIGAIKKKVWSCYADMSTCRWREVGIFETDDGDPDNKKGKKGKKVRE